MYIDFYPASGRAKCKACGKIIEKGMLQMHIGKGVGSWSVSGNFHVVGPACKVLENKFVLGLEKLRQEIELNAKRNI